MSLGPAAKAQIAAELDAAAHGERGAAVRRLAEIYGVSASAIYRAAPRGGAKRARAAGRPEYRGWVRIAVAWAERAPKPAPLDLAIEGAIAAGALPAEAAAMPLGTARRLRKEMRLVRRAARTHRLHADYPMQALLFDASTSEHLVVEAALAGGDYALRLHRRPDPAGGYKNKPLGRERLRVVVYAIWDMATGYSRAVYRAARGESGAGAMEALCAMLAETGDPERPLHGLPDDLWTDQGPLFKSAAARDLLERLDVNLATGEPYQHTRMGGVERTHRARWARFERALFLAGRERFTLAEVNERCEEFERRENRTRLSRTAVGGRQASRAAAWVALVNARPADRALRRLPDRPIETLAQEVERRVDANGVVRWDGAEYEAPTFHGRRVLARRGIDADAGAIVLEDEATGEREVARRYEARPYGAVRSAPATPLERLKRELGGEAAAGAADLYAPGAPARAANVVSMPARAAPAAPLEDPLDADRMAGLDEAMTLFRSIYRRPLSGGNRALVVERIEAAGCSRSAVVALAQELAALATREA